MTGHQAIFNRQGTLLNAGHANDQLAPILARCTGPAALVVLAQQGDDLLAQLAYRHGVDGAVDAFVTDALRWIHTDQCAADLV